MLCSSSNPRIDSARSSQALAQPLIEHRDAIARGCREHGVERLEVFGSAADGRFDPARSDFDFIVSLLPSAPGLQGSLGRRFVGLADAMEALLCRPVDLMTDKPIRNPYLRRTVDPSRRVVDERAAAQAPLDAAEAAQAVVDFPGDTPANG